MREEVMSPEIDSADPVAGYNEDSYRAVGFGAQRRYPNEELCRFMGRNFFGLPPRQRRDVRILELGCGTASNLWMLGREGFDAYGIDLSPTALSLARRMLDSYATTASLQLGNMKALPFPDRFFDCVVDVYSTYCLDEVGFAQTLSEVSRVLKIGSLFFTYTLRERAPTPGPIPLRRRKSTAARSRASCAIPRPTPQAPIRSVL